MCSDTQHPWLTLLASCCAAALCNGIGNSLNPIAIVAFLQPAAALLCWETAVQHAVSRRSQGLALAAAVLHVLVNATGATFAFLGAITYPQLSLATVGATAAYATAMWLIITPMAFVALTVLVIKLQPMTAASMLPWVFACLFTAANSLIGCLLSNFTAPGNAVLDLGPLVQLASLLGLSGLNFIVGAVGAVLYMWLRYPLLPKGSSKPLWRLGSVLSRDNSGQGPNIGGSFYAPQVPLGNLSPQRSIPAAGSVADAATGTGAAAAEDVEAAATGSDADRCSLDGIEHPSGADEQTRPLLLPIPATTVTAASVQGTPVPGSWLASTGSYPVVTVSSELELQEDRVWIKGHLTTVFLLLAALLTLGGGLAQTDTWWQRSIDNMLPPEVTVSCVLEQDARLGSAGFQRIMDAADERIRAGDAIVLTAEEAFNLDSDEQELELLANASSVLATHGLNRTYLGLAYQKAVPGASGRSTNHFVLLTPNGSIAWNYLKAYPVPVVEDNIQAGAAMLPVHDSSIGRLSGAICFDFDHPSYVSQAGRMGVDIMLQPSWTWGPLGPRHFAGNALRAAENGFTLFRCSSGGISGVVSRRGKVLGQALTGSTGVVTFTMPLEHHAYTVFSKFGHALEWVNVALAVKLCVVSFIIPRAWVAYVEQKVLALSGALARRAFS